MADDRDILTLAEAEVDVLQYFGRDLTAGEQLVDVVELQICLHDISP
jgi:hypothetical protein